MYEIMLTCIRVGQCEILEHLRHFQVVETIHAMFGQVEDRCRYEDGLVEHDCSTTALNEHQVFFDDRVLLVSRLS